MTEWSVVPEKLIEALSVLDLVPCRPGIPPSVFLQLEQNGSKLRACLSSEVSGTVSVAGTGDLGLKKPVYLDRRIFFPFVFAAKTYRSEKPFVFRTEGKQILVQQGRRKGSFDRAAETGGYGRRDYSSAGVTLPVADKMRVGLEVAAACGTTDSAVPELNCVYMVKNGLGVSLYSSNQIVVFHSLQKAKGDFPKRLAFPLFLVPCLKAEGLTGVVLKEREVALQFECGSIWQTLSSKAQKGFPYDTIDKLLVSGKAKWPDVFSLQTRRLGLVTTRLGEYLASARRRDWLMHVNGIKGEKQIRIQVSMPQGVFRELVSTEDVLEEGFDLDWPLDILLPVFAHFYKLKDASLRVRFGTATPYMLSAERMDVVVTRVKTVG